MSSRCGDTKVATALLAAASAVQSYVLERFAAAASSVGASRELLDDLGDEDVGRELGGVDVAVVLEPGEVEVHLSGLMIWL